MLGVQEDPPRRHVRRAAAAPRARRHDRRPHRRAAGRDDEHLRRTSRIARRRASSSCTLPCTRRRSSASRSTSARSSRATSSTTRTAASTSAGPTAASSASRWRRRSSSRSARCASVQAGCLLTVSDIVVEGEFTRISDDELRAAVDRMTRVGLATVTADHSTVFLVNPASGNGATGRRWPELAHRAATLGLTGETLLSERPGHLIELAERAARDGAELVVAVGGDGTLNETVNGLVRAEAAPSWRRSRSAPAWTSSARTASPRASTTPCAPRSRDARDDRRRSRHIPDVGGDEGSATSPTSAASA